MFASHPAPAATGPGCFDVTIAIVRVLAGLRATLVEKCGDWWGWNVGEILQLSDFESGLFLKTRHFVGIPACLGESGG